MERLDRRVAFDRAVVGLVVVFENFRALDAAVEGNGVADRVFPHRFAQGHERGEHFGFDFFVPASFVRAQEDIFTDHVGDLVAGDEDRDDAVVAENRGRGLERALEAEEVEGVAVDGGVVHAQDFVALSPIAALGGGHENAATDGEVSVVEQVGEKFVAVAHGLVRLVHDAEVERELRRAGGLTQSLAALVGGKDDGEAGLFAPEPCGDLLRIGEARSTEVLA